ncbi:MAG: polysaccharide deacetylase family protein [Gammaproteobacteria bacterium]
MTDPSYVLERAEANDRDLWPERSRLALSLVVNVEEGSELSLRDGDRGPEPVDELGIALSKGLRNYANESNYRYGIAEGAPRILKLIGAYGFPITFTAAAVSLERAPALARQIVNGGHEICAPGWRWIHQFRMNEGEEREFIAKAVSSIERTTGQRPLGWLSRYLTTDHTKSLLAEAGFRYHMDDYSQDLPFWESGLPASLLCVPYALDSNDMKLWTAPALTPADWLRYATDTFDWLYEEGRESPKMMSLGLHLRVIGRPGRIGYLQKFLDHVNRREEVWVARRIDIAERFECTHPAPEPNP